MLYRDFGKTGEKISALGFGCMRLPEYEENGKKFIDEDKAFEMIRYAFDKGVNYFDSAPYYCNKNSEDAVGKAVKPFRDKVLLSTKLPAESIKGPSDYKKTLEASLKKMGTDYIDFYHFWGLNKETFDNVILKHNLLEEAQKAKEEGMIRHISFSFHDDPEMIKYIVDASIEHGIPMESILAQYNLLDRSNEDGLAYAASKGLGTVAMGPVGGGRLSAPTDLYTKLTGKPSIATYELAFRFVLGNSNLDCALSGMQDLDMVQKNIEIGSNSSILSEEEWKQIAEAVEDLKKFSELYCTGCKYCQPCPVEIQIPDLFNMYTYYNVYGLKEHAKNQFKEYVEKGKATFKACKNCGFCEKNCPQHLKIREELEKVEKILA